VDSTRPAAVVILAAGEGTRMRSATPKVLHEIGGRSLLGHALAAATSLEPERLVVVVRHERDRVAAHVTGLAPSVLVADQDEIKGTGRAAECGLLALRPGAGSLAEVALSGTVIITYGDVPLLDGATLRRLQAEHEARGAAVTVLTAVVADPTGYGRIVRDARGDVAAIVEQKDADEEQRAIREINSGIYAFDAGVLIDGLAKVGTSNAQGEKYLTDVPALARADGHLVQALPLDDVWQVEGVNDRVQLAALGRELNRRTVEAAMRNGVTVVDPQSTWLDVDVRLEPDVRIEPGVQLLGSTVVRSGASIGPDTTLRDCTVGAGASVVRTHGISAEIGADASVGPYSYLRAGTKLGARGKIGGFVETKNATIGAGSKVPHLSYAGDVTIGAGVNVGAATVFVNYDGVAKHHTVVGDEVRIGADNMILAPVTIADGAYTAAGSVITNDVPPGAMAVARGRQRNVEGWVERRRAGTPAAAAAARARAAQAAESSTAAATGEPGRASSTEGEQSG
jgi:bifunctional UDP-N-acetylglucosamine pyrophosphorylase/glucosamine-1-phosphate N-acetyltransferase